MPIEAISAPERQSARRARETAPATAMRLSSARIVGKGPTKMAASPVPQGNASTCRPPAPGPACTKSPNTAAPSIAISGASYGSRKRFDRSVRTPAQQMQPPAATTPDMTPPARSRPTGASPARANGTSAVPQHHHRAQLDLHLHSSASGELRTVAQWARTHGSPLRGWALAAHPRPL